MADLNLNVSYSVSGGVPGADAKQDGSGGAHDSVGTEPVAHNQVDETSSLLGCVIILCIIFKEIDDPAAAETLGQRFLDLPVKSAFKQFTKALGVKGTLGTRELRSIQDADCPLAFRMKGGEWAMLARVNPNEALLQRVHSDQAEVIPVEELNSFWSGQVVTIKGRQREIGDSRPFDVTWFIPEFLRYRKFALEILLASAFIQCLALVVPLFFQVIMDKVLVNTALNTLDVLVTVLIVVAVLEFFLTGLRQYITTQTATRIDARLGGKLFERLTELPISYFKARSVGVTVMRVNELGSIREFLTGAANTLIIDVAFTGIFFLVMYYYSPFLTLIVAASLPCYFLTSFLITRPLQAKIEQLYQDAAINNAFLTEVLTGVETVKAMALEPQMVQRWERQTRKFVEANFDVQRLMQISAQLTAFIQKATMVAVLWFGARMVIGLELSIGQLIAFNMMANHVSQPVMRLAELWRNYVQARVSIDRLGDVLNTPTEINTNQQELPEQLCGHVRFENIHFRYAPDQEKIFEDFSLDIPAGSMVAFIGASGSGKSTLTKLIQKLYVVESGQVTIDGLDIRSLNPDALRQRMSIVLQENYLFNRSVRDNIALMQPDAPLSDVIKAAEKAGAHDFILELEDGYDTILAEGGMSLSGGQRQRIAIARSLVSSPSILIFDEATSALDDHSQEIIKANMTQIREGRTVIIVAHRLSTVRDCDQIFVLDKGGLAEAGTHDELMRKHGAYAHLWRLQAAELNRHV
ncbi:peptidase domain-containing ABC transporter [Coralliovum pocilloporae]|uniref:peptidase domain-containing ABC transporter n=1 Tax=Coralliovum pocilloporae TaxID=3066369 RepID=UPI00330715D5